MKNKIRNHLENYIKKHDLKSLVIGVSGGIDSAVCCALAKPVCDKIGIELFGVSLPSDSNKTDETERANEILAHFCTIFDVAEINKIFDIFKEDLCEPFNNSPISLGNLKARIRMIYLYDLAYKRKGMVLSTDNYTEYLLGFWTLHGDVGDFGMIQNLWKTEVYQLAKDLIDTEFYYEQKNALQLCIDAVPTDGLGITNSDLDQLGANSYEEVDKILQSLDSSIIKRHVDSEYKRNNPYNIKREDIL